MKPSNSISWFEFSIAPSKYAFPEVQALPYQTQFRADRGRRTYTFEEKAALDDIEDIGRLEEDWDADGALSIQAQTKENALLAASWVMTSTPVPGIAPNPNGTITMEWESTFGSGHLEIGRTKYSFYINRPGYKFFSAEGSTDKIPPYLGLLISNHLFPVSPGSTSTILQGNVQHTR